MYLFSTGNGYVIHLTGIAGPSNSDSNASHLFYVCGAPFAKAVVIEEPLSSIEDYIMAKKNNGKDLFLRWFNRFPGYKIVQRARSQIGPVGYNILWNNCEHFANWCRYGWKISDQVLYDACVNRLHEVPLIAH
ncbi:HRAS-like suppressor 3 [Mytilus galloprovincialis]|uniref:HRAS-like suppressor 3 n=1 Tax=Mytilus galloprovincialis TaxID=29158 RepID=A0A8B6C979_MYTGA|nr:HRAS-like suppressor 3 [Mytilus galloprovincialis]